MKDLSDIYPVRDGAITFAEPAGPYDEALRFPRWSEQQQLVGGLVVGALAAVVLYAIMRAIAERST